MGARTLNKTLEIWVSDPWEFGTEHGVGPFLVEPIGDYGDRGSMYARLHRPLTIDGNVCGFVRIAPRFEPRSLSEAFEGNLVGANFIFCKQPGEPGAPWGPFGPPFAAIGSVALPGKGEEYYEK